MNANDDLVLIDLYASWCGPCKMLSPIVDEVSKEKNIKVIKVDVDIDSSLAKKYNVNSIPTLLLFKKGELVNKSVGFIEKEELIKFLS